MKLSDNSEIKTKLFKKHIVASNVRLPRGLKNLDVDIRQSLMDETIMHLRAYALSSDETQKTETVTMNVPFQWPLNWWQHLKKQLGFKYKTQTDIKTVEKTVVFTQSQIYTNAEFEHITHEPVIKISSYQV